MTNSSEGKKGSREKQEALHKGVHIAYKHIRQAQAIECNLIPKQLFVEIPVVISPLLLRLQGVGEFKEQSLLSYSQLVLLGEGFDVGFSEDFQRRVAVDVLLLESVDRPIRESSILIG